MLRFQHLLIRHQNLYTPYPRALRFSTFRSPFLGGATAFSFRPKRPTVLDLAPLPMPPALDAFGAKAKAKAAKPGPVHSPPFRHTELECLLK